MAESERDGNLWSSTDFNPFLMDIDVVVANILTDAQTSTRQDIVEPLLEQISENTISTTRQKLFENSIERYMEKVKNAGIEVETATTLSMKRRQGVNATVSSCKDIYDLFTFNVGLTQRFPREILTSASNFIDINGPSSDHSNSKATCICVYRPGTHVKLMILGLYLIKDKVMSLPFMNKN